MNFKLMEEIIKNIFANFLIIPSNYIKEENSKRLISNHFLLNEKLNFNFDDEEKENNIWGCNISSTEGDLKILLGDCSQEKNILEFCMIIKLKDSITYGLYFYNNLVKEIYSNPMIACSLDSQNWLICNTFLQATFLAGMEHLKDIRIEWSKCSDYLGQINSMKSFIAFYDSFYQN